MESPPPPVHRYAVVACSACRRPWAVELRHQGATCPSCHTAVSLRDRTRLWAGDDPREAQAAVAHHRAALAHGLLAVQTLQPRRSEPRHDSPADAAAAQAVGIVNQSARSEAVALWMQRLVGPVPHDDLMAALGKAGVAAARAEREVVRMLACDVLMEVRPGVYRLVDAA